MQTTINIVAEALKERDKAQIGIKWPLAKATVQSEIQPSDELNEVIKEELNIKEIVYKKAKEMPKDYDKMKDWFDKRTDRHIKLIQKYSNKIDEYDEERFRELIER